MATWMSNKEGKSFWGIYKVKINVQSNNNLSLDTLELWLKENIKNLYEFNDHCSLYEQYGFICWFSKQEDVFLTKLSFNDVTIF